MRFDEALLGADIGDGVLEGAAVSVGEGVVGDYPFDAGDAGGGEPCGGAGQESGGRSGYSVDLQQVVGCADQLPLAVCGGKPSTADGSDAAVVLDLSEHRLDARGSLPVGLAATWAVELGDHRGGQRVGIAGTPTAEQLVDSGSGDLELLGGLQRVEFTGLDTVQDLGALLFGLGDPCELAGPAGSDERLDAFQVDIVAAPVARVGDDSADAPLFAGGSQILLCGVTIGANAGASMARLVTSAATTYWSAVATAWAL